MVIFDILVDSMNEKNCNGEVSKIDESHFKKTPQNGKNILNFSWNYIFTTLVFVHFEISLYKVLWDQCIKTKCLFYSEPLT